jgi:hypothetical protein
MLLRAFTTKYLSLLTKSLNLCLKSVYGFIVLFISTLVLIAYSPQICDSFLVPQKLYKIHQFAPIFR